MSKPIRACIAMAAVAAILVVPTVAAAGPTLTAPTGTAYKGTYIEAANFGITTMRVPGIGNFECETAFMTGDLTKNSGGVIEANITTINFIGTPGVTPHTNHCKSPIGDGKATVTPNHSSEVLHNNVNSLPWCLKANNNKDEFEVVGGPCGSPRTITFALHTSIGTCTYGRATVNGTYTTHASDGLLSIANVNFPKVTGSIFCPNAGELTMSFTLRTDDAATQPIYIDTV